MVFRVLRGDLYPFDQIGVDLGGAFWAKATGNTHHLVTTYNNMQGTKDSVNLPNIAYLGEWKGSNIPVFNGERIQLRPQQYTTDRFFPGTLEETIRRVCLAKQKVLPDVHKPPALDTTLEENPKKLEQLMNLAKDDFEEGNHEEALSSYVRATKFTSGVEPYEAICKIYEQQDKNDAAALAYLYLALLHLKSENLNGAEVALRAAAIAQKSEKTTELLARYLKENGNTGEAKKLYQSLESLYEENPKKITANACRILICDPSDPDAWKKLGTQYASKDSKLYLSLLAYLYFRDLENHSATAEDFFDQASNADTENPLPQIVKFNLSENLDEKIELSREIARRFLIHFDIHLSDAVHYLAFATKSGKDQDYIEYIRLLKSDFHTEDQVAEIYLKWAELREKKESSLPLEIASANEETDEVAQPMSAVQIYQKGIEDTQEPLYIFANYMRWLVTRRDPNTMFLLPQVASQFHEELKRKESPRFAKAILMEIYDIIKEHGCGDRTIAQLMRGDHPPILKLFTKDSVAEIFQAWTERSIRLSEEDPPLIHKKSMTPVEIFQKGLRLVPHHLGLRLSLLKHLLKTQSEDKLLKATAAYASSLLSNRKSRPENIEPLLEEIRQLVIAYGPNANCTKPLTSSIEILSKLYTQEEIADIYTQWGSKCENPNEKICIYKAGIANVPEVKRLRITLFNLLFGILDPDNKEMLAEDQETAFAYGELLLQNANWLEKSLSLHLEELEKELSQTLGKLEESLMPNVEAELLERGLVPDVSALPASSVQAPEMAQVGEDSVQAQKLKEIEGQKVECLAETEEILAKTCKIGIDPETAYKLALIYEKKKKMKEAVRTYFSIINEADMQEQYQIVLNAAKKMKAILSYDTFLKSEEFRTSRDREATAQLFLNNANERIRLEALERERNTPSPSIFQRIAKSVWGSK